MKIFVTGASGFLGRFLCEALKEKGHEVVGVGSKECDLTLPGSLDRFSSMRFDQIYHLAAWTQAGDFCLRHPGEQWIINQKMNTQMLDWWLKAQSQAKMICMGTSCGYDPNLPLEEEYYLRGKPIESLFTYAMTKRMLLAGLMALSQQYGLPYLYLVPSTLYGPDYHTDGRQLHFIFDLVRKILKGKLEGDAVVLWGDGHQKRELIHVRDFIKALLALAETQTNEIINIGGGVEYSIRDFAQKICAHVGYPFEKNPELTFRCNVEGTLKIVEFCIQRNITPILFSSDYVFDGVEGNYTELSPTAPLNQYGNQKAFLEKKILENWSNQALIIRLGKVTGAVARDGSMLDEMAHALWHSRPIKAAEDQIFCPILVEDVVSSIVELQKKKASGLFNLCGEESWTRYQLAFELCRYLGKSCSLIQKISLNDLGEPFARPKNTTMQIAKLNGVISKNFHSIRESCWKIVNAYLQSKTMASLK